jgi:hypothetical protein
MESAASTNEAQTDQRFSESKIDGTGCLGDNSIFP